MENLKRREASDAFLRNTLVDILTEADEKTQREIEEKRELNGEHLYKVFRDLAVHD